MSDKTKGKDGSKNPPEPIKTPTPPTTTQRQEKKNRPMNQNKGGSKKTDS